MKRKIDKYDPVIYPRLLLLYHMKQHMLQTIYLIALGYQQMFSVEMSAMLIYLGGQQVALVAA